jgi:pyruvate/oxaloacetate carboxyltransferase
MFKGVIIAAILFVAAGSAESVNKDTRQLVKFPEKLQQKMLQNMRDHMAAINDILGYMAYDEPQKAAEVAEKRLGLSARHAHKTKELAKYMPMGMRQAGYDMHSAASSFAKIAKKGDTEAAYEALSEVTGACVECHAAYKIR